MSTDAAATTAEVPDDPWAFLEFAEGERWTDGLPIVPPKEDYVREMIAASGRSSDESLGSFPPTRAAATVERVAINSVMAGCRPDYMPAVVAAIEALLRPDMNMLGVQATTHPAGFMVMFNGPYAEKIGLPSGTGLLGPGFRASATIGRAIRLSQTNIGGAYPGEGDRATQGSPAKFALCFRENEDENPWEPYHVELGYDRSENTVTVIASEGPHNINDHVSESPTDLLRTFASSLTSIGKNTPYLRDSDYFVGIGPEHANLLAAAAWTKDDIRDYLFAKARMRVGDWRSAGMFEMYPVPRYFSALSVDDLIPLTDVPEDVRIVVIGGPGRHSCWFPSFGVTRSTTVAFSPPDYGQGNPDD